MPEFPDRILLTHSSFVIPNGHHHRHPPPRRPHAVCSTLQLFARTVVEGFTTGHHASPHKGFSVEFRQHRPYVQGDEIKRLDWKIFGRSDRFYIREYDEETNLRATIVLDASGSMDYRGTKGVHKFDYARKLAASLAYLLMAQQDAVGLVTFDQQAARVHPEPHAHHAPAPPARCHGAHEAGSGNRHSRLSCGISRHAPEAPRPRSS